jgi:hypothetical protein
MGPILCPETSVNNYHTTPCNYPEDHRFHQHQGYLLKQSVVYLSTSRLIPEYDLKFVHSYVEIQVPVAMMLKIPVFWDTMPRGLIKVQMFRNFATSFYHEDGQQPYQC